MERSVYVSIDLKSFYASVECLERGLDPLTTHLVVADISRTEKTICLAVSPSLKAYGISGRARLFEVVARVNAINQEREKAAPQRRFTGASSDAVQLKADKALKLDYIVAPPQMNHYLDWSAKVCSVYLKYIAPEDIYVYSIDEVFLDITKYLKLYGKTPREFTTMILRDIYESTGVTATAGIGTNLFLCKVAMDILAKHATPDKYGVRIAALDEMRYRKLLWSHRPLTDFWQIGKGTAQKLEAAGLETMGDIARCSLGGADDARNENFLFSLFGVNAELLIDHAWGWEPCTIADIKAHKPRRKSLCSSQVLRTPYPYEKARLILWEMADSLALELVDKALTTNQLVLMVGYDRENFKNAAYHGAVTIDTYGRAVPKHARGTENLPSYTASAKRLTVAALALFDRIVDHDLLVRRITLTASHLLTEDAAQQEQLPIQLDLFASADPQHEEADESREKKLQETMITIKKKYGKNAILKGKNFEDGATGRERNRQIGGHKA